MNYLTTNAYNPPPVNKSVISLIVIGIVVNFALIVIGFGYPELFEFTRNHIWLSHAFIFVFILLYLYVLKGVYKTEVDLTTQVPFTISEQSLALEKRSYPVKDLNRFSIKLYAFTGMEIIYNRYRYIDAVDTVPADGLANQISFLYEDRQYKYNFMLTSKSDYYILKGILEQWHETGVKFSLDDKVNC